MVAPNRPVNHPSRIVVDYDAESDVLRVITMQTEFSEGMGTEDGIELDFDAASDAPSGVTVVGFHRNRWDSNLNRLSQIVERRTSIRADTLADAIAEKTIPRRRKP